MNLSQFILLELLRTGMINSDEIQFLKGVFDSQDERNAGRIEYDGIIDDDADDFDSV